MSGETDLTTLLRLMRPDLHPEPYGFGLVPAGHPIPGQIFARVEEAEGSTLIAPIADLTSWGVECNGTWARISLTVNSDLAAVGLTAEIAAALAAQGISANVVAGYFHDHLFVPWAARDLAQAVLRGLADV